MENRRVVVTGTGVISPVGNNRDECWNSLISGVNGIGPITLFDTTDFKAKLGAEVKNFDPRQYMEKSDVLRSDRYAHFAVAAAGSSVEGECRNHFTAAGLNYPDDIQAEYIAFSDAADMLSNGTIDGAWIMSGAPAAAVSQALSSGCKLLNISDEVISALQAEYPWYAPFTIPAGTYPNQDEDVQTSAIKMVMFCRGDLDEETVYQLTRVFWENIDKLGESQGNLKGLTPEEAVKDIAELPLHPGAEKYYTEIGVL